MKTLLNTNGKEFTNDHRANYNNFNKSDIFNKNVQIKENELVTVANYTELIKNLNKFFKFFLIYIKKFKNKFKENSFAPKFEEDTAFSRKLNEYHDPKTIENGKYTKLNVNMSQGYMKPQFNDYEERKVERDLTPKEKKLFEQNPNFDIDSIKNLKQKNQEENFFAKKTQGVSFKFNVPNSSIYNKVNLQHSNIFNNEVNI